MSKNGSGANEACANVWRASAARRAFSLGCAAMLAAVLAFCFGCAQEGGQENGSQDGSASTVTASGASEPVEVHVASLKGPTTIGLVDFMSKAESGAYANEYDFQIAGTADEVLPGLVNGSVDIALVPANAAATLYNKTSGAIRVIDINTLGVLYVVSGDASISNLSDLSGRTVLMTGKGTTPEYVMNYLLSEAGLAGDVQLEFKSEATEVAAALASDPQAVAVLPQPYATAVCLQNTSIEPRLDLTEEWDAAQSRVGGSSKLVTGVTVVRTEFLEENPTVVAEFIEGQKNSVASVVADPAVAATLVSSYGIIEKEAIAQAAIPACNLVCLEGSDMKAALSGYLEVLYNQAPASVGGSLPSDDFYALDVR